MEYFIYYVFGLQPVLFGLFIYHTLKSGDDVRLSDLVCYFVLAALPFAREYVMIIIFKDHFNPVIFKASK